MNRHFSDLSSRGVYKAFGSQAVLTGLDLEVPAGSFTAVLGPSGSGKTTLLRILAGFERPDRGTVAIGGMTVDDSRHHVPPEKRRIGYVAQEANLFPHLSVEANIAFGVRRRRHQSDRIAELLDALGLSSLTARYPHQLSGGQQQRVAVARALAVEPSLVLLDEPFASLDPTLRGAVRADIHTILREAGATTILVTHDQDEALSMADQVAVIRDGVIAQLATPHELYVHPADSELARFVGEANLIEGTAGNGTIDTSLGVLAVLGQARAEPGQAMTVLVRPEQVRIDHGAAPEGAPARVVSTEYYGHDAVVRLAPLSSSLPALIVARVMGDSPFVSGQQVTLSVGTPVKAWPRDAGDAPTTGPTPTGGPGTGVAANTTKSGRE